MDDFERRRELRRQKREEMRQEVERVTYQRNDDDEEEVARERRRRARQERQRLQRDDGEGHEVNSQNSITEEETRSTSITNADISTEDESALLDRLAKREERRQKRLKEAMDRQKEFDPTISIITNESISISKSSRNGEEEVQENDAATKENDTEPHKGQHEAEETKTVDTSFEKNDRKDEEAEYVETDQAEVGQDVQEETHEEPLIEENQVEVTFQIKNVEVSRFETGGEVEKEAEVVRQDNEKEAEERREAEEMERIEEEAKREAVERERPEAERRAAEERERIEEEAKHEAAERERAEAERRAAEERERIEEEAKHEAAERERAEAERKAAKERERIEAEQREKAEEEERERQKRQEEERKAAEENAAERRAQEQLKAEQKRAEEERKRIEAEEKRKAEEKKAAEERERKKAEEKRAAEEKARLESLKKKEDKLKAEERKDKKADDKQVKEKKVEEKIQPAFLRKQVKDEKSIKDKGSKDELKANWERKKGFQDNKAQNGESLHEVAPQKLKHLDKFGGVKSQPSADETDSGSKVKAGKRLDDVRRSRGETETGEFEKLKQKQQEASMELDELKKRREERKKMMEEEEQRKKQGEAERKAKEEEEKRRLKEEIERRRAEAAEKRQKLPDDGLPDDKKPFKCFTPKGSYLKIEERAEFLNKSSQKSIKSQPAVVSKIDSRLEQYTSAIGSNRVPKSGKAAPSDLPLPADGVRNIKSMWEKGNVFSSPGGVVSPNKETAGLKVGVSSRINEWLTKTPETNKSPSAKPSDLRPGDVSGKRNIWEKPQTEKPGSPTKMTIGGKKSDTNGLRFEKDP